MTPREIAQWMREEHEMVENLARRLHDQVVVAPRANLAPWLQEVSVQLDHFRIHLEKHFHLEETGGYLEAVTERRPTLTPEVERLRHEHDEIDRILRSIHRDLRALSPEDRLLIGDCCGRIQNLLRYLEDHEHRENLMVISIFTHDLGTKD